jgi:surfeit locus 1 family protein
VKRIAFLALCLACAALFTALGVWQVARLQWKLALIHTVEARISAPPRAPPAPENWSAGDAYTRVTIAGTFLHEDETLVQAVTELGPGYWVMTPLRTEHGVVLINRGFVPSEQRAPATRGGGQIAGPVIVTGLLRASEPGGGFLRANAPQDHRWYSRDVQAIAQAAQLPEPVAPYFIDADASPNPGGYPVGGLTVLKFNNSHLVYAVIWFVLAGLALAGAFLLRPGRPGRPPPCTRRFSP